MFTDGFDKTAAGREKLEYLTKALEHGKAVGKKKAILSAAGGAAIGAAGGAAADKEHRGRGAFVGGLTGALAGGGAAAHLHGKAVTKRLGEHRENLMKMLSRRMGKYQQYTASIGKDLSKRNKHLAREGAKKQFMAQNLGTHQLALNLKHPPKELAEKLKGIESTSEKKRIAGVWLHKQLEQRNPNWKGGKQWRF